METDGYHYERSTALWLTEQGCRIITRNYRCRAGEIDLVARHGEVLVFIEVRVRTNPHFASAAESVDHRKQRRLQCAAAHYLQRQRAAPMPPCRFDVVVWEPSADSGKLQARWIRNAFLAA